MILQSIILYNKQKLRLFFKVLFKVYFIYFSKLNMILQSIILYNFLNLR